MFQQFQNLIKNQDDPKKIINDMTKGYTPDQIKNFMNFANGFGISNEQLNSFGIKVK